MILFYPISRHVPNGIIQSSEIEKAILVVEKGDTLRGIARKLSDQGIIGNELLFELFARASGLDRQIKSGEYYVSKGQSIEEVLSTLSLGSVISNKITIPEGQTSFEVVKALNELKNLVGKIVILPDEGSLAPNTYFFSNGQSKLTLLKKMEESQKVILKRIWKGRTKGISLQSPEHLLVVASIIEKETGKNSERAIISSVLHNRLRKNMRLQADPTVVYGITEGKRSLGRRLFKSDLNKFSDHNTYVIKGLPKTPICNPGEASLFAAANPISTDFLYYVADGKGGHSFARTLEEHNINVKIWRKIKKESGID